MRQLRLAQEPRVRRYAAIVLVACTVLVAGLVASSPAKAAPPPNVVNARLCLNGGWRTLTTSDGRHFRNLGQCVVYALVGGQFGTPPSTGGSGGGGQTE
jgi:hypothetical protein